MSNWEIPFVKINESGRYVKVRGLLTKEVLNFSTSFDNDDFFVPYNTRKLSIKYILAEFDWYCSGDPNNEMIEKYAETWSLIKNQEKPYWNSNYGYYLNPGLLRCLEKFKDDSHTRQACIIILNNDILNSKTRDTACTYAVSYYIREGVLNCNVKMRSTDAIYGLCNDIPQFLWYFRLMYELLRHEEQFKKLKLGKLNFNTDSLHVYEKHFNMLLDICEEIKQDKLNVFERVHRILIPELSYVDCENILYKKENNEVTEFTKFKESILNGNGK